MANRICALAQPATLSPSQALKACYDACDLSDVILACTCIQELLARAGLSGKEDIDAACSGMSALLNLINKELDRRSEAAALAFQAARDALREN